MNRYARHRGLGFSLDTLIDRTFNLADKILPTRYGAPGDAGASIRLPNGTIAQNTGQSSGSISLPNFSANATATSIDQDTLLWGGLALAGIVVIASIAKKS